MIYQLFILFSLIVIKECREDFRIHYVNVSNGRTNLSIIGSKINSQYIFKLVPGFIQKSAITRATFIEQINTTGWSHLLVESSKEYSDELQAYYSGVVEGVITRPFIAAQFYNTFQNYCSKPCEYCRNLLKFLKQNFLSVVQKTRNGSGFLKMVRLMLWQMKGIQDGFDGNWKSNSKDVTENHLLRMQDQLFQLFLLQINGDMISLSKIFNGTEYHSTFIGRDVHFGDRCSAIIKYAKGILYSSHVSWYFYSGMLRTTKLYDFPYRINADEKSSAVVPGRRVSFSSYPGLVSSMDDFYITSAGLVTIETTIENNNQTLYNLMRSKASEIVFEFQRVQAANRLATSGDQWSVVFAKNNSGTYNNQWMIVNYNLMKGHRYGQRIPDGVLYVAEQIPTLVVYADQTAYLRKQSYWPSYNIPYYKSIWKLGNFQSQVDKYGDFYDYNKAPRARIFQRSASKINDELSLMRFMRYNDFKHDPLSKCKCNPPYSAINAISARCDLNMQNGTYPFPSLGYSLTGGYDMKYTNQEMMSKMTFVGISGPTYDQQPVFDWSKVTDPGVKHQLHPVKFQFSPVVIPFT